MPAALHAPRLRDLSPEQAARAAELLDEGLDLAPGERAHWLDVLTTLEPVLAPVVAALLNSAADAEPPETAQLLARRVAQRAAEAVAGDTAEEPPPSLEGRRFGPWRVLRLLGQGGMGAVWLARRDDGLFEREVALKLVHASWYGPMLQQRFAQERRILGSLEHPHIAQLLDAGVSADGQPYLALEYVAGEPLDVFCDNRRASVAQRLQLVLQVLGAVQHAHQNLVIHRDLKPANILVTADGQVRLLDFGIAKLLAEDGGEETEMTRHAGRPLTPHYAAPEQRDGRPVGTASDVYALGVVLFELLSGHRLEMVGPLAPRMSRQRPTAEAAAARATTPAALVRTLAGDLDTIVQKALKADPQERYPTADALRQDLLRHLHGLPVQARPASAGYRLRKFIGRHRWRVAAAAGMVLLLVGAAGVSLWQARQAREALQLAQAESQRAQAVQGFLLDLFNANSLRQPDPRKARQTTARELLDAGAARAGTALKDTPVAQEAVLDALANLYFQLELQGEAARLRSQRIVALERIHGANAPRVADALLDLAHDVASSTGEREIGVTALAKARAIADAAPGASEELHGWIDIETARVAQYLSVQAMRGDADRALSRFRANMVRWTNLFHATQMAARARYLAGDQAGAQALNREGLALAERYEPQTAAWRKTPWVHLAESQIEALQFADAEANLRRAWELALQQDGPAGSVTLQTQAKLGGLLHATGRREEGWRLLQAAIAALDNPQLRLRPDAEAAIRRFGGMAANARGEFARGLELLNGEIEDLRTHYPRPISLSRALLQQSVSLTGLRRHAEARAALDEALTLWLGAAADGGAAPFMANRFHLQLARAALASGDDAQVLPQLQALALPEAAAPMLVLDEVQARTLRAELALKQGQPGVAEALATGALARLHDSQLAAHAPDLEAEAQRLLERARAPRSARAGQESGRQKSAPALGRGAQGRRRVLRRLRGHAARAARPAYANSPGRPGAGADFCRPDS